MEVDTNEIKCKHCQFLSDTFGEVQSNREYWLYTEMFVYLHGGADHCDNKNQVEVDSE